MSVLHHTGTENSEQAQTIRAVIGGFCVISVFSVPLWVCPLFLFVGSSQRRRVDLQQRYQTLSLYALLDISDVFVVGLIRKICKVDTCTSPEASASRRSMMF